MLKFIQLQSDRIGGRIVWSCVDQVDFGDQDTTFEQYTKIVTPNLCNDCHTLVIIEGFNKKTIDFKEFAFVMSLMLKFLPNVKNIEIRTKSDIDILYYLLVLSQTDEKYGKQNIKQINLTSK
jgi:predicted metal-binding protein